MDNWRPDVTGLCPHGRHLTAVCMECNQDMFNDGLQNTHELSDRFGGLVFDGEPEFRDPITCHRPDGSTEVVERVTYDAVSSPQHYKVGGFEAIDVIKAKLTPDEYRGYLKGNQLKYLMRANYKDHHDQDIEKSVWYGNRLVEELREQNLKTTTERLASSANEN